MKTLRLVCAALSLTVAGCGNTLGRNQRSKDPVKATQNAATDATLNLTSVVATPVITPHGGVMAGPTTVSLSTVTPRSTIYYTLNGTTPTKQSTPYAKAFTLGGTQNVTIKAIAYHNMMTPSAMASAVFSIPTPLPPPTTPNDCSTYIDPCPVAGGVTWQCKKRFMYGVNYNWHNFGADFGGLAAWSQTGVAATPAVESEIADMKAQGASVIRWSVFPDFRGDGIKFDATDTPTSLSGTFVADLNAALALAEKYDVYLMLDVFSFGSFAPTTTSYGVKTRSLYPMLGDSTKLQALLNQVIKPMASAAEASPNKKRLIAWDVMNEPEWAMTGNDLYEAETFHCNAGLQCVNHAQMESFLLSMTQALRSQSTALITVGSAAIKWAKAWSGLGLDFYQFHTYDWVNQWYPYTKSPAQYGITDKSVVMGEWPLTGLTGVPPSTMLSSFLSNGYGGAMGWAVTDPSYSWATTKGYIKDFSNKNACVTQY